MGNHPQTFNPFFSFDDDATLYQQIRCGSTVAEAARTLGKPTAQIDKRLNSAQFKLRVRQILDRNKTASKPKYRNITDGKRTVVRPVTSPFENEGDEAVFRREMEGGAT